VRPEDLLLRNYGSAIYGLYSPTFSSVFLDPSLVPQGRLSRQAQYVQANLTHEIVHWTQFHCTPWGLFLSTTMSNYVDLAEFVLQSVCRDDINVVKPVLPFLRSKEAFQRWQGLQKALDSLDGHLQALRLVYKGDWSDSQPAIGDVIPLVQRLCVSPRIAEKEAQRFEGVLKECSLVRIQREVPDLTWNSIVECWAKIVETAAVVRAGLRPANVSGDEINRWMSSPYGRLIPLFLANVRKFSGELRSREFYSIATCCAASLLSPMHPIFQSFWRDGRVDRDFFPMTRFVKILENLDTIGLVEVALPVTAEHIENGIDRYLERICEVCHWPSPSAMAKAAMDGIASGNVRPTPFHEHFLLACQFVLRAPSFLVFGPMHSLWAEYMNQMGGFPVFLNAVMTRELNIGTGKAADVPSNFEEQIMLGVRFNFANELLLEKELNRLDVASLYEHDESGVTHEDRQAVRQGYVRQLMRLYEALGIKLQNIMQHTAVDEGALASMLAKLPGVEGDLERLRDVKVAVTHARIMVENKELLGSLSSADDSDVLWRHLFGESG